MCRPTPNPTSRRLVLVVRGVLLACACLLPACSPTPPQASPGDRGAPNGLEVLCWVVDDSINDRISFETLGEALLPYRDRPTGIQADQLQVWKDNGLRIVAVPIADLDLLHDRLRTIGHASNQWFGSVPRWTPLAGGITFRNRWTLRLDNGPLELPAGQVRLLGRAWLVPVEPPLSTVTDSSAAAPPMAAAMSLELLPQLAEESARRETMSQAYGLDPRPTVEESGINFDRCQISTMIPSNGDALVIVPEDPGVEWKRLSPARPRVLLYKVDPIATVEPPVPDDSRSPPSKAPASTPTPNPNFPASPPAIGPAPARFPTLGEAMLSDVGGTGLARRVVVVLLPRVPATFELIAR